MSEYKIELAKLEDKREIYDLLEKSFFPDMPLFEACGIKTPPTIDTWSSLQKLEEHTTLKALSKTGEISGVAINITPREEAVKCTLPDTMTKFFYHVYKESDGVITELENNSIELRLLGVHKCHRNKGLSKILIKKSEELAKKLGYKCIFATVTGAYMETAFKSQNWDCVYRYFYKNYLNYEPKFKLPNPPHTSFTVYKKEIT